MKSNNLIKTLLLLFNVVAFQLSISFIGHSQNNTQSLKQNQLIELKRIGVMIGQGKPNSEVQEAWKIVLNSNKDMNIDVAVNDIISEAKLEAQKNVDTAKNRVKSNSLLKEQISNEIKSAKLNLLQVDKTKEPIIMQRRSFSLSPNVEGKVIVNQTGSISTRDEITVYVNKLESQLNNIGDDAQLANLDLQNALQKQQQLIQMLSNISKTLNDTAMSVIRKIGG